MTKHDFKRHEKILGYCRTTSKNRDAIIQQKRRIRYYIIKNGGSAVHHWYVENGRFNGTRRQALSRVLESAVAYGSDIIIACDITRITRDPNEATHILKKFRKFRKPIVLTH